MKLRHLPVPLFAALFVIGCARNESTSATPPATTTSMPGTNAPAVPPGAPSAAPAPAPTTAAAQAPAPSNTGGGSASTNVSGAAAPKAASQGEARTIEITGNDQMQFNVKTIEAKAGEQIKVVFTNVGSLPKEAMGHNWVLLKKGVDVTAFATAAMTAKATDYIPPAMKDQVLASTPVLGPKQKAEATFTIPEAGEYIYICSFPGHYMIMRGTLTAK